MPTSDIQRVDYQHEEVELVVIQLWFAPETRTWTLTAKGRDGFMCVLASGKPSKNDLNERWIEDLLPQVRKMSL